MEFKLISFKDRNYIQYAKVFDKVYKELFELLSELDTFEKDIRIIHHLYWVQISSIWRENEFRKYTKIKRYETRMCLLTRLIQTL